MNLYLVTVTVCQMSDIETTTLAAITSKPEKQSENISNSEGSEMHRLTKTGICLIKMYEYKLFMFYIRVSNSARYPRVFLFADLQYNLHMARLFHNRLGNGRPSHFVTAGWVGKWLAG